MSMTDKGEKIRIAVAEVWDRPLPKMDTATALELLPTQFSVMVLSAVVSLLSLLIGYLSRNAIPMGEGQTGAAQYMTLPAYLVSIAALITAIVFAIKTYRSQQQYRDARSFADTVFDRILAKPSAPNFHIFERIAIPEAVGGDRETPPDESLHAWMNQAQRRIAEVLAEQAGVKLTAQVIKKIDTTVLDACEKHLDSKVGELALKEPYEVGVENGPAQVWEASQTVTFRCKSPTQLTTSLLPAALKLIEEQAHATMYATVTRNPQGAWFLLDAWMSDPQPGPASDAQSFA